MKINKPMMLRPAGKDYLWGGNRLNNDFQKNIDMVPLAETWECSTHPDGVSHIFGGEFDGKPLDEFVKEHPECLGTNNKGLTKLPILIKFIDAKLDLSVQVHPSDDYAAKNENGQLGKTEMWYVLDAMPGANLIYGLKSAVSKDVIRSAIEKGNLDKYLQHVKICKDDIFFIEPGTIHAIGSGSLVAEIQENSNLTYRLYDYNRVDKNGELRPLHIDKALEVANLKVLPEPRQPMRAFRYRMGEASELLCRCKYFEVYRMIVNTECRRKVTYCADETCFRVLLCVEGCGSISYEISDGSVNDSDNRGTETIDFFKGDCIFVPADSVVMRINGKAQFLDVRG